MTPMQTDVTISLAQVLWLIGGITAIGAFDKLVIKPFQRLDNHESRIKVLEDATQERKQTDLFMMKSLNAIVNHMIDGNGIDRLKEVRDEYQEQIINHHK